MKILYVWDFEYPWDVRTQKMCAAMTRAGHEVHLTARNREWDPVQEELPEATVHRLPPMRVLGRTLDSVSSFPAFMNPRWIRHIGGVAARVDADVIVVRDLPLCPTACWVGSSRQTPVILDMAENYAEMMRDVWEAGRQRPWDLVVRNPWIVAQVERHCVSRVDHIIVVVEESGQRLQELGVPPERISVVSNTPPRSRVSDFAAGGDDQPYRNGRLDLVYLGLMELPRGVQLAIEATALLKDQGSAPRLRLIGDGRDRDELEALARRRGLTEEDVEFLGYVPNEEALRLVAEADCGLIPHIATGSWNTTVPNKLFDYMAAGLAVISSDARPCARILEETDAGRVFRSGDAEDLARRIEDLRDDEVRERLGAAGRRAIGARYNWERAEKTLESVLQSMVS